MVESELMEQIINEEDKYKFGIVDLLPSLFYWPIIIIQIILVFFLYNYYGLSIIAWIGWGLFALFLFIGALPRPAFKKYGGVEGNKGYIRTTKLVDKGIFAIIRHPYWLSWILLSASFTLMSQHLVMILLGIPAWIVIYCETYLLDRDLVKKFGKDYEVYIKKVPRMNLILGVTIYFAIRNRFIFSL